jgi:pilus assembly protein CpaF
MSDLEPSKSEKRDDKRVEINGKDPTERADNVNASQFKQQSQRFKPFRDLSKPYDYDRLRMLLQAEIQDEMTPMFTSWFAPPVEVDIKGLLELIVSDEHIILHSSDKERLYRDIVAEILGFSVLEPLLADASVNTIIVKSPNEIYVVSNGKTSLSTAKFADEDHLLRILDRLGTIVVNLPPFTPWKFDEENPTFEGALADGTQVRAIYPTVAQGRPVLTLRKILRKT